MSKNCCFLEPEPEAGTRAGQDWTGSTTLVRGNGGGCYTPSIWSLYLDFRLAVKLSLLMGGGEEGAV